MNKDIKLSNIKGLLIFLVVFGHLIAPYYFYNVLYLFIYSFHMPLFVLVSGYFAKRVTFKKIANLLLLLIIFQPLYRSFLVLLNPEKTFNLRMEVPYYHLWYLLSMSIWFLVAMGIKNSPIKNVNKVVLVIVCFFIGIGVKFMAGPFEAFMRAYDPNFINNTYSYLRTLSFMPFFFLGVYLSEESMKKLYGSLKGNKIIPLLAITGVFAYLSLTDITNEEKILKGNYGIEQMSGDLIFRTSHILLGYIIALVMCYILLNAITDRKCFLTKWGDRTLPIYLFHAFFVMVSKKITFLHDLNPWVLLLMFCLTAVFIILILSSDVFMRYTYYLWNPTTLLRLRPKANSDSK